MAAKKIGIVLALDGEDKFRQGVQNANKEAGALKAELKKLSVEFDGNANSMDYLSRKQEVLTKQQSAYRKKVDEAQKGLKKANENYSSQIKRLTELEGELKNAKQKLEEFKNANDESSAAYKKQEQEVKALEKAYEKQAAAKEKEAGAISDWCKKINTAETELKKINREVNKNEDYMKEAKSSIDKCAKSIDVYGNAVEKATPITMTLAESIKDGFGEAIGEAAFDILKTGAEAVKDTMYDMSAASANLAAQTGLSETAMKRYNDVMQEIKGNNYGEDYADISSVMAEIVQVMGELDPTAMQETTESAIALRDTFGMDVNEQVRAVDVMIKTMGVDATQAFNLIATGAQRGLNRSGELTDNITEYAQLWGQAGFSAEEMFSIMENGLDSGAYNLDKVNDYVKEFGISLSDGRIEDNLDSFSVGTQNLFGQWKNGEATTSEVFYSVINDLSEMTNKQEALTLASEVWSTTGEDNALQVITALGNVNTAYDDVKGAMESIKDVKYSDLESAVSGLGAALQEHVVTPIAEVALPEITGLFEGATEVINGIGEAIRPQKTELETFIDDIQTSNEEVKKSLENAQNTMSGASADVATLEAYKTTLMELNEQESLTEFQKYQLANAVSELSGQMPGLAEAFDSTTGSLNLTNEELAEMFNNAEALAMQNALVKAQAESYDALAQATLNKAKADSAVQEATESLTEANKKNKESQDYLSGGYGEFYSEVLDSEIALDKATKAQEEASRTAEEAQKQIDEENKAFEALREEYGLIPEVTEKVAEGMGNIAEAGGEAEKVFDQFGNDISGLSDEAAAEVTEASQKIVDAYSDMRDGIADSIKGSMNLFEEFSGGAEISAGQMASNLDTQIAGIEKWSANMQTLAGQIGQGFSQELYDELAALGPEQSSTAVQALVDALESESGEFEEVSKKWTELLSLQENADAIAQATTAGKNMTDGIATGIEERAPQVVAKVQQTAQEAVETVENEVPNFQSAGKESANAYVEALNAYKAKSAQTAGTIASAARSALASYQNSFYNTGYNMSAGVASGIRAGQSGVVNAMAAQIRAALAAAKAEADIHSPSRKFQNQVGLQMANGVAFGVKKGTGKARKSAKELANAVLDAATSWLDKYKESHDISLKDEEYYWQQVLKKVKKSSKAYTTALKNIQNVQSKIGNVSNMNTLLSNYQTYFKMSERAEMEYWNAVRKNYAAGTEERLEADAHYLEAKEKLTDKLKDLEEDYLDAVKDVNKKLQDDIDDLTQSYEDSLQRRTDAIMDAFGIFDEFISESADGKTLLFNIKAQAAGYEDWMKQLEELRNKGILNEELLQELAEMGPQMSASLHALNSLSNEQLAEYNEAYLKKLELSQKQATTDTQELKNETAAQITALKEQNSKDLETLRTEYKKNVESVNTHISSSLLTLAQNAKQIAEDQTAVLVAAIKDSKNVKEGAESSTGSKVSQTVKDAASVTTEGLPKTAGTTSTKTQETTQKTDKILEAINSGKSRSKNVTSKEKKNHHALWEYIVKKYGRTPTNEIYKKIASELGVSVSKTPTKTQKDKILKKLKAKGYRAGGRNIYDEYLWMDEELKTKGPELVIRKDDGAMLTRVGTGAKDIYSADMSKNLFAWGKSNPADVNAILKQMQAQIQNQQNNMTSILNDMNLSAGIVKLNRLLNAGTTVQSSGSGNVVQMERAMNTMIDLMSQYLPYLPYLAERQQVTIRKQDIVDSTADRMGTALAMMSRRRRK